ncbi:hypothetical protein HU200_008920 [Digitaria exilis]|uniref:Uncharacterized protein n=1 Tax=Digitaria exilis TaxID=1010633 RepID=A0A835FKP0_9POAL|nr:hypothetical protein HU200_008920 [Digitaria exilis]
METAAASSFKAYGSFLIMSAAGATYIFAIYSKTRTGHFKDPRRPRRRGPRLPLPVGDMIFTQLYLAFYGPGGGGGNDTRPLILLVGPRTAPSGSSARSARSARPRRLPPHRHRPPEPEARAEYGLSAAAAVLREGAALLCSTRRGATQAEVAPELATKQLAEQSMADTTPVSSKPSTTWLAALRSPILQALVSVDMLLLFTATVFGVGGTLTAIDNMGQIGESLG